MKFSAPNFPGISSVFYRLPDVLSALRYHPHNSSPARFEQIKAKTAKPSKLFITGLLVALVAGYSLKASATGFVVGENWQALRFDAVTPSVGPGTNEEVTLFVDGISLTLELTPSHVVGGDAFSTLQQASGTDNQGLPELFSGRVTDDPDSWVRMSRDNNGTYFGQIKAYGTHYEIAQPAEFEGLQIRQLSRTEQHLADFSRVHGHLVYPPEAKPSSLQDDLRIRTRSIRQLRFENGISVPGALRVAAVVDSRFDEHHQGRGVARALSLINIIDGIYQEQLGVALVLDSVVAYTNAATDPMRNHGGTVESMLERFREIRMQEPQLRPDLTMVHLFTGQQDPRGVLGLGWIDTACRSDGYNVSLSTPFAYDALLAAHEMAHNLGALHDDAPGCSTDRSNIMWPRLSSQTAPAFSQCSLNALRSGLEAPCNLENIDLSVQMQSRTGLDGSGRTLLIVANNQDPVRVARNVRAMTRLPAGSRLILSPPDCTVTQASAGQGPELICELGDIPARASRSLTMALSLSTTPGPQWGRVDVASLVASDSQPANNRSQLDLRQLGNAPRPSLEDDASVTVATASQAQFEDGNQAVPGTQGTQIHLPNGSSLIVQGPPSPTSGVGGSGGGAGALRPLTVLILTLLTVLVGYRRQRCLGLPTQ